MATLIGSISSGTLRNEDLIPRFLEATENFELPARTRGKIAAIQSAVDGDDNGDYFESEDADEDSIYLQDLLSEYAPPYFYFGAHPGDGADFGFWLSEGWEDDFEGLKVDDTADVPEGYSGEVLHVSDHGNPTLYQAEGGKLTEIWSVV